MAKSIAQEISEEIESETSSTQNGEEQQEQTSENTEQTAEQTTEETNTNNELESPVITKEFVEKHKLSPGLIGKPFDELANSYSQVSKKDAQLGQELAELRKTVDNLSENLTKSQQTKEEHKAVKQTEKELGERPDPLEDIDGFYSWMERKFEIMAENIEKKVSDKYAEKFQSIDNLTTKDLVNITISNIAKGLPEDMQDEAVNILAEYTKENKEDIDRLINSGTGMSPDQLAKAVINDYKAKAYDKLSSDTQTEIERKATEKAAEALKQKGKNQTEINTTVNTERNKGKKSLAAEIADDLQEEREML